MTNWPVFVKQDFVKPAPPPEPEPEPMTGPAPLGYILLHSRNDGDTFAAQCGSEATKVPGVQAWAVPITFRAVEILPGWLGRYMLREAL